jgi:hypothetical protein
MESKEYIINKLESFIKRFSKVRVRYEYDERAVVHTIEVLPNEVYHLDEEYILWERQMFKDFIEHYPDENIGFISDDAVVGIDNPIYIKEGLDYAISTNNRGVITFDQNVIVIEQAIAKEIKYPPTAIVEEVIMSFNVVLIKPNYYKIFSFAA